MSEPGCFAMAEAVQPHNSGQSATATVRIQMTEYDRTVGEAYWRLKTSRIHNEPLKVEVINPMTYNDVLYDERGIHLDTGLDLCDCLNDECQGCFFQCTDCKSHKCGNICRVLRKFMYEHAESNYNTKNAFCVPRNY